MAFSPDGGYLATGSGDRKARLFDAKTGRLLFSMEGHRTGISSLAFSPDGARLVTAGAGASLNRVGDYERAALVWDLNTGQRLLKLDAHLNWVVAVAFSPDGWRLATGSADNTIRIREAFPWKPEDYATEAGASENEQVEAFKRHYWRERLRSASWAAPLRTRPLRPGRRLETYYGGTCELNLSAEHGTKMRPAHPIRPRAPGTPTNLVDLTVSYNAALTESWQPTLPLNEIDVTLASLPAGVQTLTSVPFDVRGIIRLSRPTWGHAALPIQVEIPVGRKFRWMHVLQGADARARQGEQIGTYRLHYREGDLADLPIIYGRDVRDPWTSGDAVQQATEAEVAWSGPADQARPTATQVRLYKRTYENPEPEREVVRMTFESAMTSAAPFLLAMTVEP